MCVHSKLDFDKTYVKALKDGFTFLSKLIGKQIYRDVTRTKNRSTPCMQFLYPVYSMKLGVLKENNIKDL